MHAAFAPTLAYSMQGIEHLLDLIELGVFAAGLLNHQISDYGGSGVASRTMAVAEMHPSQNDAAWCCKPYIETDILGFVAPGMARTAQALADRFAWVLGTFDTTVWSRFMAKVPCVSGSSIFVKIN